MKLTAQIAVLALVAISAVGQVVPVAIPYHETFDGYADNYALSNLVATGWATSTNTVVIQSSVVWGGVGKAVAFPTPAAAWDQIDTNSAVGKVWSDVQIRDDAFMLPGTTPTVDSNLTVMLFVDTNSALNAYNATGQVWQVFGADFWQTNVQTFCTAGWVRVSVFSDYSTKQSAVFLNGHLMVSGWRFINTNQTACEQFRFESGADSTNYLDELWVTSSVPVGLTLDQDNDGKADALEIQQYGNVTNYRRLVLTVTNLSGTAGSISPSASFDVQPGSTTNFVLTASNGCYVADVFTNGTSAAAWLTGRYTGSGAFTYTNITADTLVQAQFGTNPVATVSPNAGGSVSPSGVFNVYPGTAVSLVLTASNGYCVADVLTNGVSAAGGLTGRYTGSGAITFNNITADFLVQPQFSVNPVITVTTNTVGGPGTPGGTISPGGSVSLYPGTSNNFVLTANPAFVVSTITTNAVSVGTFAGQNTRSASYTCSNVWANVALNVTFTYTGNRRVPDDYGAVEDAVAAAWTNDTIVVSNGTYTLGRPIVVAVPVTITGNTNNPGAVVVNAPTDGVDRDCFQVQAPNVTVQGFHLAGAQNYADPTSNGWRNAAIMVGNDAGFSLMATNAAFAGLTNGLFQFNEVSNCSFGVYVNGSTNCFVRSSRITGNTTGVFVNAQADARTNWWGAATGPSGAGLMGTGDAVSTNVIVQPWWANAAGTALGYAIAATDNFQQAVNLGRASDVFNLANSGSYTQAVTVSNSIALLGGPVTIVGSLAITGGVTVTSSGALTVTGLVSIGASDRLCVSNVTLVFGSLSIATGGLLQVTSGSLTVGGVTRIGTFTVDSMGLQGVTPSILPWTEGFEGYGIGTMVQALGAGGWNASGSDAQVQVSPVPTNASHAVLVPALGAVYNTVASNSVSSVWVDFSVCCSNQWATNWLTVDTNQTVMLFVNSDHAVVFYDANLGVWETRTTDVWGASTTGLFTNNWGHLSLNLNYQRKEVAIFANGHLIRESLRFINTNQTTFAAFELDGSEQVVSYLDDVSITNGVPVGLTDDGDHDGVPDALEIQRYGSVWAMPRGSVFEFR